jgi:hypothetical protein
LQSATAAPAATRVRPARWGAFFAIAVLGLVNGAFVLNNLALYLGMNYAGAMTMFSGINPTADNHFLMPKLSFTRADRYVTISRLNAGSLDTQPAREFQVFASWTNRERRLVNLNFVRYHVTRMCQSAPNATLELSLRTEAGQRLEFDNACAERSMLGYTVLSKYPECKPSCHGTLQEWAMGRLRAR